MTRRPGAPTEAGLRRGGAVALDRASATDLMELATDTPDGPQHVAAVLVFEAPVEVAALTSVLAQRLPAVPRLRQRLRRTPRGAGRPLWVDDVCFDLRRHVSVRRMARPPDVDAVLDVAAEVVVAPLPRDRPLWSAVVVSGPDDRALALVIVLHHVLTDGVGGLAALTRLMDGVAPRKSRAFPSPKPTSVELWREAWRTRAIAVARLPRLVLDLRDAASELHLGSVRRHPPPRTSLNRPIGPARRLAVVQVPLREVVDAAHRRGVTVNDVLLTAVGGALAAAVNSRGERASSFVISVPVSARPTDAGGELGNRVGVLPVEVPAAGDSLERLVAVAVATRQARERAGRTRGSSAGLLAPAFRLLGLLGLFGWFITRQRLVTTFVTNVRGPATALSFADVRIAQLIPVSPIAGNVTVAFAALSYAGTLTVTVIADRDSWPDHAALVAGVEGELRQLIKPA